MEPILILLVLLGVLVISALAFVAWLLVKLVGFAFWLVLLPFRLLGKLVAAKPMPVVAVTADVCVRADCSGVHPRGARFCPRCGAALSAPVVERYSYAPRERLPVYA